MNEQKPVCSEEITRPPMTFAELRQRLKHIAGLCWGLSIDLANEIQLRENITAERDRYKTEADGLHKELVEVNKKLYWHEYSKKRRKQQ